MGQSQSELHDPPSPSSDPYSSVPVKPAIRQPSRSNARSSNCAPTANSQHSSTIRQSVLSSTERRGARSAPIHPSQCIPSGLGPTAAGSGGIIMPTGGGMGGPKRCGSTSSTNGGYVSPQWGWYISTTPPTPERYNHHPSSQQQKKWNLHSNTNVAPIEKPASVIAENQSGVCGHSPVPTTQPVFTKGVKGVGSTPGLGWPSVPL